MFFYVDGTATLCCWDATGREIIGDVNNESVLDIWNGAKMKKCRDLLDAGQRDKIELCSRCDAYKGFDFSQWEGFDFEAYKKNASEKTVIPINPEPVS
jgi:hypothetical protein